MIIREAKADDAEKFINMLKELDTQTQNMYYEPDERKITIDQMQDRINNIYTINISEEIHSNDNTIIKHSCVGEIPPERLNWFKDRKEKLEEIIFNQRINLWLELKQINTNLRTILDEKVVSVHEDYFDEMIMHYTNTIFTSCMKIVGDVFYHIEDCYSSDSYILWRILQLIKNNKITYRGNLENVWEIEIMRV